MFGRCGFRTRYQRFHVPVRFIPERYLAAVLSGRPDVYALVVRGPSGAVTALASAHLTGSGAPGASDSPGAMEIGILVEDESQRRGLGRLLLERVVAEARRRGIGVIEAVVLREQAWILRLLRVHETCETTFDGGAIVVTLRLGTGQPAALAALLAVPALEAAEFCLAALRDPGGVQVVAGDDERDRRRQVREPALGLASAIQDERWRLPRSTA